MENLFLSGTAEYGKGVVLIMKKCLLILSLVLLVTFTFSTATAECGIGDAAYDCAATEPAETNRSTRTVDVAAVSSRDKGVDAVSASYATESSTRGFVYRMYKVVLGREPEEAGFEYWVSQLESGKATAAELVDGFFNSNEYIAKAKTNEQILTDCYQAMMNRDPDAGGKAYWMDHLNVGMTPSAVCAGFVYSNEFQALAAKYGIRPGYITLTKARDQNYGWTSFVHRLYLNCIGREPDVNGLEYWCQQLEDGMGGTDVAAGFVFSNEMYNKHLTNTEFVEVMYKSILGREYDQGGLEFWKERLDFANTRQYVLNGFMTSNEFEDACEESGIWIGDLIYTMDDTDDWLINIALLDIMNEERARYGVPKLATRQDLWEDVSMVRSFEISDTASSYRPDWAGGGWWSTVVDEAGLGPVDSDWITCWENWATGVDEPITEWFTNERLHDAIIDESYENFAGSFYPDNNWEMVLYTNWMD